MNAEIVILAEERCDEESCVDLMTVGRFANRPYAGAQDDTNAHNLSVLGQKTFRNSPTVFSFFPKTPVP